MIRRSRGFFAGALSLALLTACATSPPPPTMAAKAREQVTDFTLNGRFALQLTRADGSVEKAAGRLEWQHDSRRAYDRVQLATPLGSGLAQLQFRPGSAQLTTSDRRQIDGTDPVALLQEATGFPLPVMQLPDWLLGRTGTHETLTRDPQQRPQRLDSPPWRIDYRYPDAHPDSLPQRLDISHPEIGLRLFVEEWQTP